MWLKCAILDCGDATPSSGFSNPDITVYGTVVSLTCSNGYSINGASVIECQSDGSWNGSATCDPAGTVSNCTVLPIFSQIGFLIFDYGFCNGDDI